MKEGMNGLIFVCLLPSQCSPHRFRCSNANISSLLSLLFLSNCLTPQYNLKAFASYWINGTCSMRIATSKFAGRTVSANHRKCIYKVWSKRCNLICRVRHIDLTGSTGCWGGTESSSNWTPHRRKVSSRVLYRSRNIELGTIIHSFAIRSTRSNPCYE